MCDQHNDKIQLPDRVRPLRWVSRTLNPSDSSLQRAGGDDHNDSQASAHSPTLVGGRNVQHRSGVSLQIPLLFVLFFAAPAQQNIGVQSRDVTRAGGNLRPRTDEAEMSGELSRTAHSRTRLAGISDLRKAGAIGVYIIRAGAALKRV